MKFKDFQAPVLFSSTFKDAWEPCQKRAIHIIQNFSRGKPYMFMLSTANPTTLASRTEDMSRKFFTQITEPTPCLHQLLSDPRAHCVISRLRTYEIFPPVIIVQNDIVPLYSMH